METILKIEQIEKYYGNRSSLTKALDTISFEVEKGEFIAIMGASGSGKTTLLNCISTLDKVSSGKIYMEGDDITRLKGNQLNRFRREKLGFIFQEFNLLDTLTAFENIALALSIQNVPAVEITKRVHAMAEELDIESVLSKYPYEMSGGQSLEINGKKYIPKYRECQEGFVELAAQQLNGGIVLVPDGAVTKDQSSVWGISGNYKAADREGKQEQEKRLNKVIKKEQKDAKDTKDWVSVNTRLDIAQSSVGLGALVTFVALYLGIIFLISSAAILALKELSESADNRQRYDMLRKIGVDEKDIHKALFKQIGIYFAFPLLLAVIHSIVGIRFIHILLETMGVSFMLASVGMTAVLLIVVYGGYFILTYLCSRSMIRPREN